MTEHAGKSAGPAAPASPELERLFAAMVGAYTGALREGCDANGAFECLREAGAMFVEASRGPAAPAPLDPSVIAQERLVGLANAATLLCETRGHAGRKLLPRPPSGNPSFRKSPRVIRFKSKPNVKLRNCCGSAPRLRSLSSHSSSRITGGVVRPASPQAQDLGRAAYLSREGEPDQI